MGRKQYEDNSIRMGCYALDRVQVKQFQVWGVSDRLQQVLDMDGNWHHLMDCAFVKAGEISVIQHKRRDQLFNNVDWNDSPPIKYSVQLKTRVA